MKRSFLALAIVSGLAVGACAQAPQNPPDSPKPQSTGSQSSSSQKNDAAERFPFPEPEEPTAPPHSSPRDPNDSSSRDNPVDLTPPADDDQHEGSTLLGPNPAPGVVEMKPWNPHQADKDVEVGLYYFKQKNYRAAESRFREALHWQDNHAEATYRLAITMEKLGRPADAREYYRQYLKILPNGDFAKDSRKALDRLSAESDKKAENKIPSAQP